MKRFCTVIFLSILFLSTKPVHALDLSFYPSYWNAQDGDSNWGFGGKVGVPVLLDVLTLDFRLAYHDDLSGGRQPKVSVVPFDIGATIKAGADQVFVPYGTLGFSYLSLDASDTNIDDQWGLYGGGGLNYQQPNGFFGGLELLYRVTESSSSRNIHLDGFSASGVVVNFHLGLRF